MPEPLATPPTIQAPIIGGSGVCIVHRALAAGLTGYALREMPPSLGTWPPLAAAYRPARASLVHSIPEIAGRVARRDCPLVVTFHSFYTDDAHLAGEDVLRRWHRSRLLAPEIRRSVRLATQVTAVSEFIADIVADQLDLAQRPLVIRNGIDTRAFHPGQGRPGERVRVLFAGNPGRHKGTGHLLALAAELPASIEVVVTGGMRSTAIESLPRERIRLLPPVRHSDMPSAYRDSDILFSPSRREGFGLAIAEAMSCGLPVLATRCSAIPELVVHGRGGYLFDPGDEVQMRDYLLQLARDPVLRHDMGAFNRERIVSGFGLERMLLGYRQLFSALGVQA